MTHTERAVVVLEDGSVYSGGAYGARGRALGEIVFSTGMTGYQETFTDPSYPGRPTGVRTANSRTPSPSRGSSASATSTPGRSPATSGRPGS